MLKFIRDQMKSDKPESEQPSLELAATILLLETADADGEIDDEELGCLRKALCKTFQLDASAVDTLLLKARQRLHISDGVYRFARRLREAWSADERQQLLVSLWLVVFADGKVDRYEESHLRQVADQLGLTHAEYMQAKHAAESETQRA